jgi:hypothetical protein
VSWLTDEEPLSMQFVRVKAFCFRVQLDPRNDGDGALDGSSKRLSRMSSNPALLAGKAIFIFYIRGPGRRKKEGMKHGHQKLARHQPIRPHRS